MAFTDTQQNRRGRDLFLVSTGAAIHGEASATIATADATTLASAATLAAALYSSFVAHQASAIDGDAGGGAHLVADTQDMSLTATPLLLADLYTFTSRLATYVRKHFQNTAAHGIADSTDIPALHAADLDNVMRVLNGIKAALNAHYARATTAGIAS